MRSIAIKTYTQNELATVLNHFKSQGYVSFEPELALSSKDVAVFISPLTNEILIRPNNIADQNHLEGYTVIDYGQFKTIIG